MTRAAALHSITKGLGTSGFLPVGQRTPNAIAHYFRDGPNGLILNLGVELSRRWRERFTGSFYLGPSFTWSLVFPTFPRLAYRRLGVFLTKDERARLLEAQFRAPGVVDAWWNGFTPENVRRFVKAIDLTFGRFLKQPGIAEAVAACPDVQWHSALLRQVIRAVRSSVGQDCGRLTAENIDPVYSQTARRVLSESAPAYQNDALVQRFARDAWRVVKHKGGVI